MTTKAIKLIVFIAFLVHGIGHFQGVVASAGVKISKSSSSRSWLFKKQSDRFNNTVCFVIFLLTGICGIFTALSFKYIVHQVNMWQTLAIITAILSTICLIVFHNRFAMFFNKAGAIGVNLFIYYSVAFGQNWPSVLFEN